MLRNGARGAEKRLERTAQRQEKKAERQAQKEREAEERAESERLADLTVDEETGEILEDAAEALPQEAEILHLNLKSVIMPLRTTMIICLQRIMRISKKIMHLIQRMCQPRSFRHLWWLREMTRQSRLISRLRNSCSINYLI